MTVYDLIELFIEKSLLDVFIFDGDNPDGYIYEGSADNVPDWICCLEVCSIDNPTKENLIIINVQSKQ